MVAHLTSDGRPYQLAQRTWPVLTLDVLASMALFAATVDQVYVGVHNRTAHEMPPGLHAVPDSELFNQAPELNTASQLTAFAARVKRLVPGGAVVLQSDLPDPAIDPAKSSESPPPAPPPSKPSVPTWVLESKLAPRPAHPMSLPTSAGAEWAFEVLDARPGVVLVGGHDFPPERAIFNGATILLVKVCSCHPVLFGLILNQPSNETMASAFCPTAAKRFPAFVNNTLHVGGPAGPAWTVLHPQKTAGSTEVLPGLAVGGSLLDLQSLVSSGAAVPTDALFFSGYSAFPLAQLQAELMQKKWTAYKASAPLLINPLAQPAVRSGARAHHASLVEAIERAASDRALPLAASA